MYERSFSKDHTEDRNAQWVQDLIKATQTDEMKAYFQEHDKGALVPMWQGEISIIRSYKFMMN